MPKLPSNMAALSIIGAIVLAGLIAALSFAHAAIPTILNYAEAALIAGGLGIAQPPTPPVP